MEVCQRNENVRPDAAPQINTDVVAEVKSPVKKARKNKKEKKSTLPVAAKTVEKVEVVVEPQSPKPILENTTPASNAPNDAAKAKKQRKRDKKQTAAMEETAVTKKVTSIPKPISPSVEVDESSSNTEQVCKTIDRVQNLNILFFFH